MAVRRAARYAPVLLAAAVAAAGCGHGRVGPAPVRMYAGIPALAGATSVWQDGVVRSGLFRRKPLLVYTAVDPHTGTTRMGEWVVGGTGAERALDRSYPCPYDLGALTIVGINASGLIRFTAARGGAGSLDLRTGVWAIN